MAENEVETLRAEVRQLKAALDATGLVVSDMHRTQAQIAGSIILAMRLDGNIDTGRLVAVLQDAEGASDATPVDKALLARILEIATATPSPEDPDAL